MLIDVKEACRFGFDWPRKNNVKEAHVQVIRVSSIERGKKGTWRVVGVHTEWGVLNVYVSPSGRIRAFRNANNGTVEEMKTRAEAGRLK